MPELAFLIGIIIGPIIAYYLYKKNIDLPIF